MTRETSTTIQTKGHPSDVPVPSPTSYNQCLHIKKQLASTSLSKSKVTPSNEASTKVSKRPSSDTNRILANLRNGRNIRIESPNQFSPTKRNNIVRGRQEKLQASLKAAEAAVLTAIATQAQEFVPPRLPTAMEPVNEESTTTTVAKATDSFRSDERTAIVEVGAITRAEMKAHAGDGLNPDFDNDQESRCWRQESESKLPVQPEPEQEAEQVPKSVLKALPRQTLGLKTQQQSELQLELTDEVWKKEASTQVRSHEVELIPLTAVSKGLAKKDTKIEGKAESRQKVEDSSTNGTKSSSGDDSLLQHLREEHARQNMQLQLQLAAAQAESKYFLGLEKDHSNLKQSVVLMRQQLHREKTEKEELQAKLEAVRCEHERENIELQLEVESTKVELSYLREVEKEAVRVVHVHQQLEQRIEELKSELESTKAERDYLRQVTKDAGIPPWDPSRWTDARKKQQSIEAIETGIAEGQQLDIENVDFGEYDDSSHSMKVQQHELDNVITNEEICVFNEKLNGNNISDDTAPCLWCCTM